MKLKTKFFEYLGQHQEEWKAIKEEKPLQYMPYMESHFQALTGIKLKGPSQFTDWIKPGSCYHGVVARKGQIHRYLHLDGTMPPTRLTRSHGNGEQGMASPGCNKPRPVPLAALMKNGGGPHPQSVAGQGLGDGKVSLPITSCSRIARKA